MPDDREDLESFLPPRDEPPRDDVPLPPPPPPPPPLPPADLYGAPGGLPPRKPKTKRGEIWPWQDVWRLVLTQPNEETFHTVLQDPTATRQRAYTWVFFVGLATGLIDAFGQTLWGTPPFFGVGSDPVSGWSLLCGIPLTALLAVLFFAISAALQNFVARMLGGAGTFDATTYALAAIYAPMTLASSLISSLLPAPLSCVSVFLIAYWVALNVIAIKAVHDFTWGQALLTVFAPLILIGFCAVLVIFGLLVPVVAR